MLFAADNSTNDDDDRNVIDVAAEEDRIVWATGCSCCEDDTNDDVAYPHITAAVIRGKCDLMWSVVMRW